MPHFFAVGTAKRLKCVGQSDQWREGGPHAVSIEGTEIVLLHTEGGWRAYDGRCPHQGALLAEGTVDGPDLICRGHGWRFDVATGRRRASDECLRSCPVEEHEGQLWIDVSALALAPGTAPAPRRRLEDLPGPRGAPILGNLSSLLDLPNLHATLERWARTFGPLYVFHFGRRPVLAVADPVIAEKVLRARPESFRRMSKMATVIDELGVSGVFSAEGSAWRPQRRLAMEALSNRNLSGFYPTLRTVAERLRSRWSASVHDRRRVDILDDMKRFTVDVSMCLVFGHDMNTLEQGDDVIRRKLEVVFPAVHRRLNAPVPYWRLVRLPGDRRVDRALAELRAWLHGLIASARVRLASDHDATQGPATFLDAMLNARDEAGQPFSDELIFGNSLQMLLAGEDTTANTLAWAVHHLCDDPRTVAALRAELDAVLGADAIPSDIEQANRLTWATAVALETMRLRPVVPLLFLESNDDVVVGDVAVPRHTRMAVLLRPPARDPNNFGLPDEFHPDRWLGGEYGEHETATSMPFGTGPRICPGRTLGLVEIRVALATLYKSFEVERESNGKCVREAFAFTMSPQTVSVRLRNR